MNEPIASETDPIKLENEALKNNLIEMQNRLNALYTNLDLVSQMKAPNYSELTIRQCVVLIGKLILKWLHLRK